MRNLASVARREKHPKSALAHFEHLLKMTAAVLKMSNPLVARLAIWLLCG
jgi:hypothetical protein